MKTAYLRFKPCENNEISEENFKRVGSNSGNNLEPSSGIPQYYYRRMKDTAKGE